MTLATADDTGYPASRVVLLKGFDDRGFTFYTNTQSEKGIQLAQNPRASLCFHWMPLRKQVRVRGDVTLVSTEEADDYFATRPRDSQIGAWASDQSRPVASRAELEARVAEITKKFQGEDVPRPPHWSGYRVAPLTIEFWLHQPSRLHDRLQFRRSSDGWESRTLYP